MHAHMHMTMAHAYAYAYAYAYICACKRPRVYMGMHAHVSARAFMYISTMVDQGYFVIMTSTMLSENGDQSDRARAINTYA